MYMQLCTSQPVPHPDCTSKLCFLPKDCGPPVFPQVGLRSRALAKEYETQHAPAAAPIRMHMPVWEGWKAICQATNASTHVDSCLTRERRDAVNTANLLGKYVFDQCSRLKTEGKVGWFLA